MTVMEFAYKTSILAEAQNNEAPKVHRYLTVPVQLSRCVLLGEQVQVTPQSEDYHPYKKLVPIHQQYIWLEQTRNIFMFISITQQAFWQGTEKASQSCSYSLLRSHSIANFSSCGR